VMGGGAKEGETWLLRVWGDVKVAGKYEKK